jgi:hypothetical protein
MTDSITNRLAATYNSKIWNFATYPFPIDTSGVFNVQRQSNDGERAVSFGSEIIIIEELC